MLGMLRASVSGIVAKILIGLLVISFAVWGVADAFRGDTRGAVVSVGETEVSAIEYGQVYLRTVDSISQQFGTQLTSEQARAIGIDTRVIGEVVSGAVLDENARVLNLGLSKTTLARLIGEDPIFRGFDGNFSREIFQQSVNSAQMREADYLKQRDRAAVRGQIFEAVAQGDILPKTFMDAAASYTSEGRKFEFIELTAQNLNIEPKPSDADVKKYFDDNKTLYRAPEYRKIAILKVEPEDIVSNIDIDAEDIKVDYDSRIDKYTKAERRRVQQIVFAEKEKAETALKSLQDGTLFETLLIELDLKIEDVDLGILAKSEIPDKAVADAAFSLELNSPSGLIDGRFGTVIVRATAVEPSVITSFEEVKDKIKEELALAKAADEVINIQDAIEDQRAGGATFQELATNNNLKLRVIDAIDASGKTPDGTTLTDLPNSAELLRGVFEAEVGEDTDYLNVGSSGYAWFEVQSATPARDQALDEVKEGARDDWRKAETELQIGARATSFQARLEEGETLQAIAEEIGASVQSTEFLKRSGNAPRLNANAVRAGFSGSDGNVAISGGIEEGTQVLLKVTAIQVPDSATLPDNEKNGVNQSAANDILQQLVEQLSTRYGVTINEGLIRLAQNQGFGQGGAGHPDDGHAH